MCVCAGAGAGVMSVTPVPAVRDGGDSSAAGGGFEAWWERGEGMRCREGAGRGEDNGY